MGAAALAPVSAAESESGKLALEPIGGFTEIANVRILTTELCPPQSTGLVARISGAGFKPDSNVFHNQPLSMVQKMPDGSGYVAPIFADWDYLASAHDAELPLEGLAKITLLCADADLERIDARMEGSVRFESESGERSTFLQEGGPRIASGIPGVPAPGNGGVPEDAPTAPPPGGTVTTDAVSDVPGSSRGESDEDAAADNQTAGDGSGSAANSRLAASQRDSGPPTGLIALGSIALLIVAGLGYVVVRRPDATGYSGQEGSS